MLETTRRWSAPRYSPSPHPCWQCYGFQYWQSWRKSGRDRYRSTASIWIFRIAFASMVMLPVVNRSFDNHLRRTIDQIAHIRHIGHIFRSGDQIHLRCLDRYPALTVIASALTIRLIPAKSKSSANVMESLPPIPSIVKEEMEVISTLPTRAFV